MKKTKTQAKLIDDMRDTEDAEEPINNVLRFLRLPHKIHRQVYIAIIERYLIKSPYYVGLYEAPYSRIGDRVGIEEETVKQKVKDLHRNKYIHFIMTEGGMNRSIIPDFKLKDTQNAHEFLAALAAYREQQRSGDTKHTISGEVVLQAAMKIK